MSLPSHRTGQSQADSTRPPPAHPNESLNLGQWATLHKLDHKLDLFQRLSRESDGEYSARSENQEPGCIPERRWHQPWPLYFTIAVCSFGAAEHGWTQASMFSVVWKIAAEFRVGTNIPEHFAIARCMEFGVFFGVVGCGAWLAVPLNGRIGRRGAVFIASIISAVAHAGSSFSIHWAVLVLFRLLLGVGIGITASTVPIYAAECAPASVRGGVGAFWQVWTSLGFVAGLLVNIVDRFFYGIGWRAQLIGPLVPAILTMTMVYACPESPVWHVKNRRYDLAYHSWNKLRIEEIIAAKEVYESYLETKSSASAQPLVCSRVQGLWKDARVFNAVIASCAIMVAQQLCAAGVNRIATIAEGFRHSATLPYIVEPRCFFVLGQSLAALSAVWYMDTIGRRGLILWTLPFIGLATMVIPPFAWTLPYYVNPWVQAVLMYSTCFFYGPGVGAVPYAYSAEVYPSRYREIGMSTAVATNHLSATVLGLLDTAIRSMGFMGSFVLYLVFDAIAFALVFLFVRETKGKTLHELNSVFESNTSDFISNTMEQHRSCWKATSMGRRRGYIELPQEDAED